MWFVLGRVSAYCADVAMETQTRGQAASLTASDLTGHTPGPASFPGEPHLGRSLSPLPARRTRGLFPLELVCRKEKILGQ